MSFVHSPKIITEGLILSLDAGNVKSYPGSGTVWRDKSGRNYNLTLINGPTFSNGAIYLEGTDDEISTDSFVALNNNPWSICGWLYYQNVSGDVGLVWGSASVGNFRLFSGPNILVTNGLVDSFYVDILYDGISHRMTTGNRVMRRNSWNFVTITYNSGTCKIYLDGIEYASELINPTNISFWVDNRIQIGRTVTTNSYIGGIATTQIYNRALSASEVLQNYNATKSRFNIT
jgi:hypothetical protein